MEPVLQIPKINLKTLSTKELAIYDNLDSQPYGKALARQVAIKLSKPEYKGRGLFHSHRDYCGLGLCFDDSVFQLGVVNDGYMPPRPIIISFKTEAEFIQWLVVENDQSMALYGEKFNNQTITKIRLDWFLEDHYSPVWNDYCRYLRDKNHI